MILEEEEFVEYLRYLQYWKRPEYAKFITYPHCLHMLELLQDKDFRALLKNENVCEEIHLQQFYHWQYFHGKPPGAKRVTEEGQAAGMD